MQIHWIKSQIRSGDVASPQLLTAAAGRNAAGTTTSAYARFWLRQNRVGVWKTSSQASNLVSTAIAAMQFGTGHRRLLSRPSLRVPAL